MVYSRSQSGSLNMECILESRFEEIGEADLVSYTSWMEKHPSALESFEEIMRATKEKHLVVFLDYDGTLSPIVSDPNQAFMNDPMRSAVREVANCYPTAIVSGRSRDKVYSFVKLKNLLYAGSHGMDISTSSGSLNYGDHTNQTRTIDEKGNKMVHFQPAQQYLSEIQQISKVLKEKTHHIKGSMVEDNKFCISVHFRRVKEKDVVILTEIVESSLKAHPNLRMAGGKKVIEIRPSIDWDKGHALRYLLDTFGFHNSNDVLPLYIGDDKTDEDAFKVIKRMGTGFPIVVSSTPKETNASYSLRDTTEVMSFLIRLAKWKRTSS